MNWLHHFSTPVLTNLYRRGIPSTQLMFLTGHKTGQRCKYIKVSKWTTPETCKRNLKFMIMERTERDICLLPLNPNRITGLSTEQPSEVDAFFRMMKADRGKEKRHLF